jgi:cytochrome c peroxidase
VVIYIIILSSLLSFQLKAQEIDLILNDYISTFNMQPAPNDTPVIKPLFILGRELFNSRNLSLSGDISCADCHSLSRGTSDGLPLSIGTGATIHGQMRLQGRAGTTRRHSPVIWNLGEEGVEHLFWDGRVRYYKDPDGQTTLESPSAYLNGTYPILQDVVQELDNVLALQAAFPPTNKVEMRGDHGDGYEHDELWQLITDNVLKDPTNEIKTLLTFAFPGVQSFHIGHIAKALAHYQKIDFMVNDTPWDNYLRGDRHAMTIEQKRGAIIFLDKGRCVECHNGSRLSNGEFENVLIPDVGLGVAPNDKGRFEVTKNTNDLYKFLVPGLRNIALSAPYTHNGSLQTLEEVIEHYDHPMRNLMHFSSDNLNTYFGKHYNQRFVRNLDREILSAQLQTRSEKLSMNLNLTSQEKGDLLIFLKESLTSKRWKRLSQEKI